MKLSQLENNIKNKKSFLCLGLDTDIDKIPKHLFDNSDPVFEFNKVLIDELNKKIVAVKLNTAFYESRGAEGWTSMKKTINYLNKYYPELFTIADAKRGDIGPSSKKYAFALLEQFGCDAITVSPYMGYDSIEPFLNYKDKGIFVLCLTSNSGANDFQVPNLYLQVAEKVREWNVHSNLGLVVGATHPERVLAIREKSGPMPFLIPGIGAQGGALEKTLEAVQDGTRVPCLINASRSILYPEKSVVLNEFKETQEFSSKDCISSSRHAAHELHQKIRNCLEK